MKKFRKMAALFLSLCMILALAACGGGGSEAGGEQDTYNWKLAHEEYDGELEDVFADHLAAVMKEKSDGKVNLQVYTVGTLGDSSDLFELTQTNTCEFGISCPGAVAPIIPEVNIFSMHFFLPSDPAEFDQLLESDSKAFARLNELYGQQGVTVLKWAMESGNVWTANKAIKTPADFNGVKFRTMAATAISESYNAYGANAVPIPYSEMYSALNLGMADGQVNPYNGIVGTKVYEVQDYLMLANPDMFLFTLSANNKFYQSLSDEMKQFVSECVEEAYNRYKTDRDKIVADQEALLRENLTVVEFTDEDRAPFREIAEANRDIYTDLVGNDEMLTLFAEDMEALGVSH